jgi:hypothetical protein
VLGAVVTSSSVILLPYIRVSQIFNKSRSHFKILSVTWSKFHSEDPQILNSTIQDLSWWPGIWELCTYDITSVTNKFYHTFFLSKFKVCIFTLNHLFDWTKESLMQFWKVASLWFIYNDTNITGSQESSISKVTRLHPGKSQIQILVEARNFFLLQNALTGPGAHSASYSRGPADSSSGQ